MNQLEGEEGRGVPCKWSHTNSTDVEQLQIGLIKRMLDKGPYGNRPTARVNLPRIHLCVRVRSSPDKNSRVLLGAA